ncbi:MAG: Holliday junction resolvase RuvX [Caldithrix sp.]|nr:Holliday junction resolvase RuvX [Caldithrix sp.]
MNKLLALDVGEKRIGLAISDGLGMFAHPLRTLYWKGIKNLIAELHMTIDEQNVEGIVIGIPYTLKGTVSKKTQEVIDIAEQLADALDVPVTQVDERLTTRMAERSLQRLGKKPSKTRDQIDQIAAVYILQSYLDKNR